MQEGPELTSLPLTWLPVEERVCRTREFSKDTAATTPKPCTSSQDYTVKKQSFSSHLLPFSWQVTSNPFQNQGSCYKQNLPKSPTYKPGELSKMQTCVFHQHQVCEGNCSLPSISYCWRPFSSTTSHPLSLLHQSLFLPVPSMPAPCASCYAVLLYSSRCCAVRLKMFSVFLCFSWYHFCDKYYKPTTVQHYIANFVGLMGKLDLRGLGTRFLFHIIF